MGDLFQAKRGTVVRTEGVSGGIVTLKGLPTGTVLMLTNVQANRQQVVQYIKTLDTSNFGYAWGEGPGSIKVSGLIFFIDGCDISGKGAGAINDYYSQNNVYSSGKEQELQIGDASFLGYLEKLQISAEQNEYNFGTFSLEFTILPKS